MNPNERQNPFQQPPVIGQPPMHPGQPAPIGHPGLHAQMGVPGQPGPPGSAAPRGWWSRNWGWVVAGSVLTVVLMCGGLFAAFYAMIGGAMQGTQVYRESVVAALDDPWVQQQLGEPMAIGEFDEMRGSINVQNSEGDADLAIPISGPNGTGTIYTEAYRDRGEWYYTRMVVEVDQTGEWVDLLR